LDQLRPNPPETRNCAKNLALHLTEKKESEVRGNRFGVVC